MFSELSELKATESSFSSTSIVVVVRGIVVVVDVVIEGLSLARTQKEEFNSIIANNDGNIEALFENLNKFIEN